jgi:hypothetical protein
MGDHQQRRAQANGQEKRPWPVKGLLPGDIRVTALKQKKDRPRSQQAHGDVDIKNGPPGEEMENDPTQGRSRAQAQGDHRADQAQGPTTLRRREDIDDQGRRAGHDHGRANALKEAGSDEPEDSPRQAAEERAPGEEQQPQAIDLAATAQVGETAKAQEQGGDGEQIDHHHPLDGGQGNVKVAHDRRHRDIDDAAI